MEYFAEIIKNKEAKARALEILRKRNERHPDRPSYNNEFTLLDKMIKTWLQEEEFIKIYDWLHYIENNHDCIYEYSPDNYSPSPLPDFIGDDKKTYDLKVCFYHMEAAFRYMKPYMFHNADHIICFSIQDNEFYQLNREEGYKTYHLMKKSEKLSYLAKRFLEINDLDFKT